MSTLLHAILDRAPALATLAQECKGCPGTLCKGCHGTEHALGCPTAKLAIGKGSNSRLVKNGKSTNSAVPLSRRKGFLDNFFRLARHSSRISGRTRRAAQRTHRDWFGTEEFPFPKAGGRRE